ncbi:MAG: VTC domain-containing protein [Planctomycetota bacterium]
MPATRPATGRTRAQAGSSIRFLLDRPDRAADRLERVPTRYEQKFWIPDPLAERIRLYLRDFCEADRYATGDPPAYEPTTLQFDTPDLSFLRAREENAVARFKLRMRCYDTDGGLPVLVEIKRRIGHRILKGRARVRFVDIGPRLLRDDPRDLVLGDEHEVAALAEFQRLARLTGARPMVLIRYRREAWSSRDDDYARVTIDSALRYRPVRGWGDWGTGGSRWRRCDLAPFERLPFPGRVLELKATDLPPKWMQDLVQRFEPHKQAVCKYALAMGRERSLLPPGYAWAC